MSTAIDGTGGSSTSLGDDRGFFGHPRGLSTLFFTEMWERFSYYGMRAILTLYMTKALAEGGLGFDEKYAALIYATYVSSVWYLPLIGGWLADRVFGARRAVLIGGIIIACGHYSMAVNTHLNFYAGLILIATGTGLLKPNISAMVGQLYQEKDQRRDAGFSIFYMGINLGAFLSPIIVGFLAQHPWFRHFISSMGFDPNSAWHWGFGAAGVGMTLGLVQYLLPFTIKMNPKAFRILIGALGGLAIGELAGLFIRLIWPLPALTFAFLGFVIGVILALWMNSRNQKSDDSSGYPKGKLFWLMHGHPLNEVGKSPQPKSERKTASGDKAEGGFDAVIVGLAVLGALIGAALGFYFGDAGFVSALFPTVVGFFAGYLIGTTRLLNGDELKRVLVIFILFIFSILFWMTYEQAGSSLTLFADRMTQTTVFGWQYPSSWFQSVPAIFVIIFAPMFAALWQKMGDRQPSSPGKFIYGLFFAGMAFVVVTIASMMGANGRVSPWWLVAVYLIQTFGELCLSPVGLSTVTKLSPARMVGLMMGVWFLSISIGSYIAGLTTRLFEGNDNAVLTRGFAIFAGITLAAALVLAVLTPLIKKLIPREAI
ncbi:MAG TPA: oligopeptide:H+ symporter [Pyrinomonadaceae bacterium]